LGENEFRAVGLVLRKEAVDTREKKGDERTCISVEGTGKRAGDGDRSRLVRGAH